MVGLDDGLRGLFQPEWFQERLPILMFNCSCLMLVVLMCTQGSQLALSTCLLFYKTRNKHWDASCSPGAERWDCTTELGLRRSSICYRGATRSWVTKWWARAWPDFLLKKLNTKGFFSNSMWDSYFTSLSISDKICLQLLLPSLPRNHFVQCLTDDSCFLLHSGTGVGENMRERETWNCFPNIPVSSHELISCQE